MSKKFVAAIVLVAVVGAGLVVWLWKPWAGARNQSGLEITIAEPEPATACTVVCVNKTDKRIEALEIKYSGKGLQVINLAGGSGGQVSMQHSPQGGQARI